MALGEERHSGKTPFLECNTRGREAPTNKKWCGKMEIFLKHSSRVHFFSTRGSQPLSRVPHLNTRGRIFLFFVFLPHFFVKSSHIIWNSLRKFRVILNFLVYFISFFFILLNFLAYFKFELQVHDVMKFLNSKNDIHCIWCMLRSYLGSHMKFRTSFCRNMTNN
jgi:hypothetical protein